MKFTSNSMNNKLKTILQEKRYSLEAFSVDNGWAAFVVFLLGDPHLLEGGEGSQDGSSDPYGVFSFWWSNDLDFDGGWSQGSDFLLHSVSNTWVHGSASRHDGVGVQVLTDVNIAFHDGVVGSLMDTAGFHSQEGWLEEGFWGTETFVANGDDLSIGQFVGFFQGGGGSGGCHFLFEVKSNIAELFLDVTDNFALSGGGERVASLGEDLHEVVSELTSSQVQTEDGVLKVSNMIWVIFSRLAFGLSGASVKRTGCSSGATRSSLWKVWCQIFSISSQLVMIPCSTGYFKVRIPLLDWASSPTKASFCPIPTMTPWCLGRPTMDGKTALGASSPANPALHMPEPLSTTKAATSSSHMLNCVCWQFKIQRK